MTPVRAPDTVRGDVPGLRCRGMPVSNTHGQRAVIVEAVSSPADRLHELAAIRIDWSDRASIYLCLAWLADRGHVCLWMLPTTHGGKVTAHDGLTAWEVSAILVARSVVRVARGLGPVTDLVYEVAWGTAGCPPGISRYLLRSVIDKGSWHHAEVGRRYNKGPRIDERPDMRAKALTDGCALLDPSGILLPD